MSHRGRSAFIPLVLVLAACSGPASGQPSLLADVPFDFRFGMPIVELEVNGEGPYRFVVDTGAGASVIDEEIAESLGLEVIGRESLRSPGAAAPVESLRVRADRITLGGLSIEPVEFATMRLVEFSGGTLQGVLGLPEMHDYLVTFDYPASRLRIAHGSLDATAGPGLIALTPDRPLIEFPLELGGRSLPFHLDTGSPGGLTLPKALAKELPLRGEPTPGATIRLVGGAHPSWNAQFDGVVQIGAVRIVDPDVVLTTFANDFGNLGNAVLRELVVTVDHNGGLVRIEGTPSMKVVKAPPGKRGPVGVVFAMTPSGFVVNDGGLVVERVDGGSPADSAGLRAGDIVLAVNDVDLAAAGMSELRRLFGGPRPLHFDVRRDGDAVAVTVN